jgi:hypothetical protein
MGDQWEMRDPGECRKQRGSHNIPTMTARFSYEATASMVLNEAGAPTDTEWERVKSMALTKRRNIVQLPPHLSADQDNTLWCIPVLSKMVCSIHTATIL